MKVCLALHCAGSLFAYFHTKVLMITTSKSICIEWALGNVMWLPWEAFRFVSHLCLNYITSTFKKMSCWLCSWNGKVEHVSNSFTFCPIMDVHWPSRLVLLSCIHFRLIVSDLCLVSNWPLLSIAWLHVWSVTYLVWRRVMLQISFIGDTISLFV